MSDDARVVIGGAAVIVFLLSIPIALVAGCVVLLGRGPVSLRIGRSWFRVGSVLLLLSVLASCAAFVDFRSGA